MRALMDKLLAGTALTCAEYAELIGHWRDVDRAALFDAARAACDRVYGKDVYLRGLIEISNYCKNDCRYCGIRRGNARAERYRLGPDEILDCCRRGYAHGLRTFVLQGGEDPWFTAARVESLVREIKARYPDCAVTLSLGEHPYESYAAWRRAGADRYLLRHETADAVHYARLHPAPLTLENRMRCLQDLKRLGYQVGAGFMVGSPGQTAAALACDLCYLRELRPQMVGIGPFIPHHDTPFADEPAGDAELTLFMLALTRLLLPGALLPATTALNTVAGDGLERGILAGANVVMPNLTPPRQRQRYLLYDNKTTAPVEQIDAITARIEALGYRVAACRGDSRAETLYYPLKGKAGPA